MAEYFQKLINGSKAKARSIMFTALVILGLLQIIAGAFLDMVLYVLAIIVVMVFTKVGRL